jgi:hypothetical protein
VYSNCGPTFWFVPNSLYFIGLPTATTGFINRTTASVP